MHGLSIEQQTPAAHTALNAAKSTLRVLLAAYFLSLAVAFLLDPTANAPLSGLFPSGISVALLIACSVAILFNTIVRIAVMLLSVFVMLSACNHMGLAAAGPMPEAFWLDVTLLALLCLVGLGAEKTVIRLKIRPGVPRAPSGPVRPTLSEDYAQALQEAGDRWDRDAA